MNLFRFRGTWSVCDILPNEQEQMPMEESANMLLMLAGIVQRLNTSDFLQPYWNLTEIWAQYLNRTLPDPGNQLCTDDFVCDLVQFYKAKIKTFSRFRKDHHHIIVIWP
jgi:hypothetical protein